MTDNETIARFVGKLIKGKPFILENREVIQIRMPDGSLNEYPLHSLPAFHLRWELLMPVWYKFRDLKFEVGDNKGTHCTCKEWIADAIVNKGPTPSEACRLLAEGIRWYNTINKQNEGKV
jgi:hypothetical protein